MLMHDATQSMQSSGIESVRDYIVRAGERRVEVVATAPYRINTPIGTPLRTLEALCPEPRNSCQSLHDALVVKTYARKANMFKIPQTLN